jgi:hypothetical protein
LRAVVRFVANRILDPTCRSNEHNAAMTVDICSIGQFSRVLTGIISDDSVDYNCLDLKSIIRLGGEIVQHFFFKSQQKTTSKTLFFVIRYQECSSSELVQCSINLISAAVRRLNDQVSAQVLWHDCFASSWKKDDAIAMMKFCSMSSAVKTVFSVPLSQRELAEFSLFEVSFLSDFDFNDEDFT